MYYVLYVLLWTRGGAQAGAQNLPAKEECVAARQRESGCAQRSLCGLLHVHSKYCVHGITVMYRIYVLCTCTVHTVLTILYPVYCIYVHVCHVCVQYYHLC